MKEGHASAEATSPGVLFFIFIYLKAFFVFIYLLNKQKKYCEVESVLHRLLLAFCNEAVKLLSGVLFFFPVSRFGCEIFFTSLL